MNQRNPNLAELLDVGLRQRLRRIYGGLARDLRLKLWFPHLPLAAVIALIGLVKISPAVSNALGLHLFGSGTPPAFALQLHSILHGAGNVVIGLFLLLMAIGLALRSRLAWVIVLVLISVHLLFNLLAPGHAQALLLGGDALLLVLLGASYRSFQRSSVTTGTLFAIASVILLMVYAVSGSYELGAEFNPPITDLTTAIYFSIETMSTVGYGDITPKTVEAKLFVISLIVLGISIFAASLSAILVPVINKRIANLLKPGGRKMNRTDHYVIVGDTPLSNNTYKALRTRHQNVTMIFPRGDSRQDPDMDVVVGDPSNLDVLREAGADHAKAVLALRDDDSENAFVVLAMRELNEKVKTVAVVHNSRNLASVKRVHPDLIISPMILGSELLAMALSGEDVKSHDLLDQLLVYHS
ncbi:MAG: voltage-gated potassium channel protein [Gammaproteobacteria bacterium]|nr:voltage-gated potassium channel protein [Gammaproteobacteria bacterium]MDE2346716.1 voltage-gated potassium channel protein [Gammaproteobacteria bacterium]